MNTTDMNRLRSKIEASLITLEATASNAKSEIQASSETNPNAIQDELDCAKGEVDLQTAFEIYNRCVSEKNLLKNALARMETGSFGVCLACGDSIESRRLNAHPGATRCIDCQECNERGYYVEPKTRTSSVPAQIRWAA